VIDRLLARCSFPPVGSEVACAVSGGADSLALLVLAVAAGLRVTAIHVDHGLRPGSAGEAMVVKSVAADVGAHFEARTVTLAPGPNLEARARVARYGALPAGVMTGHTADDRAETVLVNLLRGAGLDGMAPMRAQGRVVRPLLALRRSETWALCRARGLAPVEDPSNHDRRFTRNRVRHELLPLLAEIGGRDPVPVLIRQAELLGAEASLLDLWAAQLDATDARALAAAPEALAKRAIRSWLRVTEAEQHPPTAAEVSRVLAVVRGEVVACQLAGDRRVQRSQGRLSVVPSRSTVHAVASNVSRASPRDPEQSDARET
jgi:tRNA(Ile)-lysidine synthase